jgi:Arc/MetJ-type ribon-helix-helix transcriptional regulator
MTISLSKADLEQFVRKQVEAGHFTSPAEVVEAGLARLMLDPSPEDELDDEVWAAIECAEAEFERGEDLPFEEVAAGLRAKYLK